MRKAIPLVLGLAAASLCSAASAQDSQRFQMERTDGGFMVMDTHTGTTSFCRESGDGFICGATSREKATETDVSSLRKKITELEARIEALESGSSAAMNLPSETEFEQTLNFMERFFRRFVDIVKGLESEETQHEQLPPAGRT